MNTLFQVQVIKQLEGTIGVKSYIRKARAGSGEKLLAELRQAQAYRDHLKAEYAKASKAHRRRKHLSTKLEKATSRVIMLETRLFGAA